MSRARALVTGGARRVGAATVLELARSGFDVVLHFHGAEAEAEAVAEQARGLGAGVSLVRADLAEPSGCQVVIDAVLSRWSGLELLVNNASVFRPKPFGEISLEDWAWMQAVNVRAPFLLSQGLLGALRAGEPERLGAPSEQHGVVVHLVDIGAERPVSGFTDYSCSKAALQMLVKAMAVELAPAVRTLGVSPGQVIWPEEYGPELRAKLAKRIPLGRAGEPEDVARLIRFLVREAHYLNGAIVPVDGGLSCRY